MGFWKVVGGGEVGFERVGWLMDFGHLDWGFGLWASDVGYMCG